MDTSYLPSPEGGKTLSTPCVCAPAKPRRPVDDDKILISRIYVFLKLLPTLRQCRSGMHFNPYVNAHSANRFQMWTFRSFAAAKDSLVDWLHTQPTETTTLTGNSGNKWNVSYFRLLSLEAFDVLRSFIGVAPWYFGRINLLYQGISPRSSSHRATVVWTGELH